ncbi:hypothetical protein NM688_g799 [Phlebia brevispora]|uniref:Uncharacterized protein n=1 Tax=Phlebia brevispora TaxID=194682 RepID=A0ACC1TD64_9APHY|nr:hypothetical protein NM688_g799 [Phlebia brevispora]
MRLRYLVVFVEAVIIVYDYIDRHVIACQAWTWTCNPIGDMLRVAAADQRDLRRISPIAAATPPSIIDHLLAQMSGESLVPRPDVP